MTQGGPAIQVNTVTTRPSSDSLKRFAVFLNQQLCLSNDRQSIEQTLGRIDYLMKQDEISFQLDEQGDIKSFDLKRNNNDAL